MQTTHEILVKTKAAAAALATVGSADKARILHCMADSLLAHGSDILAANARDMDASAGVISPVMADRLRLTDKRIAGMAQGMRDVAALPDPVGEVLSETTRPNGMVIRKVRVPFGLIAIIYESRPNVTSDAVALALRSGNACVLRCGKEAHATCSAVMEALKAGIANAAAGVSPDCINLLENTSRASAAELMTADGLVDLLIPRGGAGLIRSCVENATVPCIQTGTGICHVYVDESADLDMAVRILVNAKASRPSVCNAAEVCLVHRGVAADFLPLLKAAIVDDRAARGEVPVELRLDPAAAEIIPGTPAGERDFDTEFLNYILAVHVVDSLDDAISHIARHSTGHSECIVTSDGKAAERFTAAVDSAAVYVNVSTRFTDGGEFGLGCEMGISTQKLHARGPMGLCELTTYKYIITGNGQIRS
jgi:glutamate-5-semialdehyde dehydrogenase